MVIKKIHKKLNEFSIKEKINIYLLTLIVKAIIEDGDLLFIRDNEKLKKIVDYLQDNGHIIYGYGKYLLNKNGNLYKILYVNEIEYNDILALWDKKIGYTKEDATYPLLTSDGKNQLYKTDLDLTDLYKASVVYLAIQSKQDYKMTTILKNFVLNFEDKYRKHIAAYVDEAELEIKAIERLNNVKKLYFR